jgi:formate hydrogenlyase subunit 4
LFSSYQTGLSPLVPGQWKSLLAAYGALYAVISLMRPLRVAAAIGMSKTTERFLDETQARLGCSRGLAMFVEYALGWVAWVGLIACGVSMASACSGVPIWAN